MKGIVRGIWQYRSGIMAVIYVVVLAVYYCYIPGMRRPLENLLVLIFVLSVASVFIVKWQLWRGAMLVVASLALSLFALEMAQKVFNIMDALESSQNKYVSGAYPRYTWEMLNPTTYLRAKRNAIEDGVDDGAFDDEFNSDKEIVKSFSRFAYTKLSGGYSVIEGIKPTGADMPLLGFGSVPDNISRFYVAADTNEIIHDGLYTVDGNGARVTRCNNDSDGVYIFTGCSFMFGFLMNDDQTLPAYFSKELGYSKDIINISQSGWGPHQVLRDFELDYHLKNYDLENKRVKRIFYNLIGQHPGRVVKPNWPTVPYYLLEDGVLRYKGIYEEYAAGLSNISIMMNRSRIYPILRDRVRDGLAVGGLGGDWYITIAVLQELDRICRERYGVRLTILHWDDDPAVYELLENADLETIKVVEAFQDDWSDYKIKYYLYDYYPSAYANRKLAAYLARREK